MKEIAIHNFVLGTGKKEEETRKLSVEELKKLSGLTDLTDGEAEELILSIVAFADLLLQTVSISQTDSLEDNFNSTSKAA